MTATIKECSANINNFIFRKNFRNIFKKKQKKMVDDALSTRVFDFSYKVPMTDDYAQLFYCFLESLGDFFKKFTLIPKEPSCYACVLDDRWRRNLMHDHKHTGTISSVFYLKQAKSENGVVFQPEHGNVIIKPEEFDMLIFSSEINHKPLLPSKKKDFRLSVNIETYCKESAKEIFNINNIKRH